MWTFLFLLLSCICTIQANHVKNEGSTETYRLPSGQIDLKNLEYEISLKPSFPTDDNAENSMFDGSVSINLQTIKPLKEIVLHAADMTIDHTTLKVNIDNVPVENVSLNTTEMEKFQLIKIVFDRETDVANMTISMNYTGNMRSDMYGFYLSSYMDKDNKKQWLGSTQFESTFARRAFPCFDEPEYKATFSIIIDRSNLDESYKSLSNGILIMNDESKVDHFKKTQKMSTYLVAFVVSKFTSINPNKQLVQVWARPEAIGTGDATYSAEVGQLGVDKLGEFTEILYKQNSSNLEPSMQMQKLDMAAIPDFSAGAMENWGLLTFRETALLYNDKLSTTSNKQRVATVVIHELGHQWFGDYVTLKWWENTWLNEGFATYCEYHITDQLTDMKTWQMADQFIIEQQQAVFVDDSLTSTKPLTNAVNTPQEIQANFGTISYNKGGSVIRMMEHMVGTEDFKNSLNKYLTAMQYNNSEPEDLFSKFKDITINNTNYKINEVMTTWITNPGYPLVTVSLSEDNKTLTFKQARFYLSKQTNTNENVKWYIPINYVINPKNTKDFDVTSPIYIFHPKDTSLKVLSNSEVDAIFVNVKSSGYYRVKYEGKLLDNIKTILKNNDSIQSIHHLNRAQLVDDAMNLARAGEMEFKDALDIITYLKNETNYFPWYSAFKNLRFLLQRFTGNVEIQQYLKDFIKDELMTGLLEVNRLDSEPKNHIEILNWVNALEWACKLEDEICTNMSMNMFKTMNSSNPIPPNSKSIVYCTAIRHGNEDDWNKLKKLFDESKLNAEQITIINALGCSTNETILDKYLAMSIDPMSGIRKQDANYVFTAVYTENEIGLKTALNFLKENWDKISDYYGGLNAVSQAVTGLAERFTNQEQIDDLIKFLETKQLEDVSKQAEEIANTNINWTKTYETNITDFLCGNFEGKYCNKGNENTTTISNPTTSEITSQSAPTSSETTSQSAPTSSETTSQSASTSSKTTSQSAPTSSETTSQSASTSSETNQSPTKQPISTTTNVATPLTGSIFSLTVTAVTLFLLKF